MNEQQSRGDGDPEIWFREHFDDAADQVLDFLAGNGISLEGKAVADIGAGDGIIDLGLAIKGRPEMLVGYDIRPTDVDALRRAAQAAGAADELPEALSFAESGTDAIPAPDDRFDVVVTWSVFEHVSDPVRMLSEIERVLVPGGVLFLQLWPFFGSEHGGHLWPHFDEPFPHMLRDEAEIRELISGRRATDPTRGDAIEEFESLNRMTVEDLQRALLAAGLRVVKVQLLADAVQIPDRLAHLPLHDLGIAGIKLLAVSRPRA